MEKRAPKEVAPIKLTIKKECVNDDIKEFAETAMNELLGWYGYGKKNTSNRSHSGSCNSSTPDSPKPNDVCGWCGKPVDESTPLSSSAATFCSELCFSQSRRANFKKNKICDWCRHVRHTVSYVDSQEGSSQLQFCSDKCLNQYKMHIFWKETRAHLEIHPHLPNEESSTTGTLITPELWLSKCKSPDLQSSQSEDKPQTSPLPLITVAHPSKLMPNSLRTSPTRKPQHKKAKKKFTTNVPNCTNTKPSMFTNDMPQDLRVKHTLETTTETVNRPTTTTDPRLLYLHHFNNQTTSEKKSLDHLLPPPTLLVPYPLILPLPIPIPIPIPIPTKTEDKEKNCKSVSSQTEPHDSMEVVCTENGESSDTTKKITRKRRRIDKNCKLLLKNKSRKNANSKISP